MMEPRLHAQLKVTPPSFVPVRGGVLQRKCACGGSSGVTDECEECGRQKLSLQRSTQNSEVETRNPGTVPPIVHEVLRSPGQPLDPGTRAFMEPRFGHDFIRVRIHADAKSAESARAVNARAYTVAHNVVFGAGEYQPGTRAGQELLAHELTHVVQQRGNTGTSATQPLDLSSPGDAGEVEAEKTSRSIVAAPSDVSAGVVGNVKSPPTVQRDVWDAIGTGLRQVLTIDPRDVNAIGLIFNRVVTTSIATASRITLPAGWTPTILSYARSNLLDGAVLLVALARLPSFYRGGWILSTQPAAGAMTLNYSVFANGPLSLSTVVHELTHVFQYGLLGVTSFLVTYFGTTAATIAYRWLNGLPLNPMRSSPHENEAYNLEARFKAWHISTQGTDPDTITV